LIDESTKRYLGDRFVLDQIGEVSVKGKEQTLMVYRVIGYASPGLSILNSEVKASDFE
jgi:class 3 adenylate cyclase